MLCPKCGAEMHEVKPKNTNTLGPPSASGTYVPSPGSASSFISVTYMICPRCGYGKKC